VRAASQRPVLILAAWAPELRALGRVRGVVTRIVGVGLVEAGVGAARAVAEVGARAVVLVGTAGAYPGSGLEVGAVVAARRIALACPAVASGGAYLPAPLPSALVTSAALRRAIGALPADVACPLAITRTRAIARRLADDTGAAVETLEAFAVARAAGKLPFAAVLGIANEVGPNAHRQWKAHAAQAAAMACDIVIRWLRAPIRR
jgi:nucleoside phosphorylase